MHWYHVGCQGVGWYGAYYCATDDSQALAIGKEHLRWWAASIGPTVRHSVRIRRMAGRYNATFEEMVHDMWSREPVPLAAVGAAAAAPAAGIDVPRLQNLLEMARRTATEPEPAVGLATDRATAPEPAAEPAPEAEDRPTASALVPSSLHRPVAERSTDASLNRQTASAPSADRPTVSALTRSPEPSLDRPTSSAPAAEPSLNRPTASAPERTAEASLDRPIRLSAAGPRTSLSEPFRLRPTARRSVPPLYHHRPTASVTIPVHSCAPALQSQPVEPPATVVDVGASSDEDWDAHVMDRSAFDDVSRKRGRHT
jgi:hypothetical protein